MDIEGLRCDILDVLQSDDYIILQKWITLCREFRSCIAAKIEEKFLYEKDCTKKKSVNTEKMSELEQEIDTVKSNIDATVLQQKIMDKKISNAINSQQSLQDEFDAFKAQKDALSLEMIDLQIEIDERKGKKILQWDAIKRACGIYKTNLDIHISLQEEKDCQNIKISFFPHKEAIKDKYFVQLSYSNNHWIVEQVEPKLSKEQFKELNLVTDCSEHLKVSDITLFLCQVRNIFLKQVKDYKMLNAYC